MLWFFIRKTYFLIVEFHLKAVEAAALLRGLNTISIVVSNLNGGFLNATFHFSLFFPTLEVSEEHK